MTKSARIFLLLAALACPVAKSSVSDLRVEIAPNGPSFMARGTHRDIDIVIHNSGPDEATSVVGVSSFFNTFPIGDVFLANPPTPERCGLYYTDLVIPPNQETQIASFSAGAIASNSSRRCTIRVIALARGVASYTLAVSALDVSDGSLDPNLDNNIDRFTFNFLPPAIPLGMPGSILAIMAFGIFLITWRSRK